MNPNDVAPMVGMVCFFIVTGLVLILRPISKKLGSYLEVLAEERRRDLNASPMDRADTTRIAQLLENVDARLQRLEEKQDFTDKLLVERKEGRQALP